MKLGHGPKFQKWYTVDHYFRGTKILRIGAHVHIRDTNFLRMCCHLYKKKSQMMQNKQPFIIIMRSAMEAVSFKATGGVPVEIASTRGPAAVKVTCENTEVANPFVVVT